MHSAKDMTNSVDGEQ
jgi:hypothetical protein